MPMMYLKHIQIKGEGKDCQGTFCYAQYDDGQPIVCPHCRSEQCVVHGYYERRVRLRCKDGGISRIRLRVKRLRCTCCHRTFVQDCSRCGLRKWSRRNTPFDAAIGADAMEGISNKALAKRYQCSESTIERVIHRCYDEILRQRSKNPLPHVLGIDEHSIHKGRKYAVTLVDLKNHSVYEVLEGKSLETILPRIRSMPGADRVKVVCMDLSPTFRSLANRIFPQARVVADRFHVIKLIIEAFLEFCREAEPDIRWKRGITMALRKHRENLTERQRRLLAELFRKNRGIAIAHQFKEKLCRLLRLKGRTRAGCVKPLRELKRCVDELLHDAPVLFRKLGRTLREWFEPIIRMWRFTRNNGITEGFHRKMKLIQRRAYGFRNFGNYRLRVLVECGHR